MSYQVQSSIRADIEGIVDLFSKIDFDYVPPLSWEYNEIAGSKDHNNMSADERYGAIESMARGLAEMGQWFIARDDSTIVGAALAHYALRRVLALGVDPAHRRKGIAYDILGAAIDYFFSVNDSPVEIKTWETNNHAQALFRKRGFKETERDKGKIAFALSKEDYKNT